MAEHSRDSRPLVPPDPADYPSDVNRTAIALTAATTAFCLTVGQAVVVAIAGDELCINILAWFVSGGTAAFAVVSVRQIWKWSES